MTRGCSTTPALVLRLILVVGCLLPFGTPRQLAPVFGFPTGNLASLPAAPSNEEDDTDQEEAAREAATDRPERRSDRPDSPAYRFSVNLCRCVGSLPAVSHPSPTDPFNNGLGSPYRC